MLAFNGPKLYLTLIENEKNIGTDKLSVLITGSVSAYNGYNSKPNSTGLQVLDTNSNLIFCLKATFHQKKKKRIHWISEGPELTLLFSSHRP